MAQREGIARCELSHTDANASPRTIPTKRSICRIDAIGIRICDDLAKDAVSVLGGAGESRLGR